MDDDPEPDTVELDENHHYQLFLPERFQCSFCVVSLNNKSIILLWHSGVTIYHYFI